MKVIIVERYVSGARNTPRAKIEINYEDEVFYGEAYWSPSDDWIFDYDTKYHGLKDSHDELVLMSKSTFELATDELKKAMSGYENSKKAKRVI